MDGRSLTAPSDTHSAACAPNWSGAATECYLGLAFMTFVIPLPVGGYFAGTSKELTWITESRHFRPTLGTARSRIPTGISQAPRSCSRQPVNDLSGSPSRRREVIMRNANVELRRISTPARRTAQIV